MAEKLEGEVTVLEKEIELMNNASTTSEACKVIASFVSEKEQSDSFLRHTGENPYLAAPSAGGGCCSVS